METIEPRAPHGDRVAGPGQSSREKQDVAYILYGADGATRAPDDANSAHHNEDEANPLLGCERLSQYGGSQDRHHQRHHAGK